MKRSIYSILFLLLIFFLCSSVFAEEAKQAVPLSLKNCIEIAMRNNTDVLTAKNNLTVAKSSYANALSNYLPQISLQNNTFTWGDQGVLSQVTTGTALTVSQSIFDGGVREANTKSASYGIKKTNAGLTRTLQTVLYGVSKAYYEVLRARHLETVAQANVTYNEGLRDQIKERVKVGDAAKVDVLPIEAQLASAHVSLLSAKNTVRTSKLDLQNNMGLLPQSNFDIQEVDNPPDVQINMLDSYIAEALKSRQDIAEAKAATGAARASVKSARIDLYPRPTISAEYQHSIQGGFTTSGSQMVGGIVFDLFNGGANRAAYREAKANRANAELQERQTSLDVRSDVEEAYLNLTNAKERIAASALSLKASQDNYEAQKDKYAQGLGTTLDLLNAEVQLITAQSDDVEARYDYYIAVAQLEYAVGK